MKFSLPTISAALLAVFSAVPSLAVSAIPCRAAAEPRPNLIFVWSDQQSWDMVGCYGNRDVQTPNLDKLASGGVRFNNCVSNSPVCTPYRGILFSGQHPLNTGTFTNDLQMLPGGGKYFGEVLRDAGYHTGFYGKWHLYGGDRNRGIPPGPYRYGFDDEFLVNNCTLAYDAARAIHWSQDGRTKEKYGDWEPYAQTRQAMEFIDRNAGKPFALFLSWHPPHNWDGGHDGYNAPRDLLDLYDPAKLKLRPTVNDTPKVRSAYQGHLAMITGNDRAFGWLMRKLDERGLAANTIVVFTSDHGDTLESYSWHNNKGRAENLSCRVPLLVHWPAQLKPGTNDSLIGSLDLMPTLLGLMKLPVPDTCQGRNASAAILEGRDDGVDALPLLFIPLNWRGVYTKRYTYSMALHSPDEPGIAGGSDTFNVLYDRQTDPWETHNLFDDPKHADVRAKLQAQTFALMQRFGDAGLSCNELLHRVVRPEDLHNVLTAPANRPAGWEGRLKGRPVDVLKQADAGHSSSRSSADMPSETTGSK